MLWAKPTDRWLSSDWTLQDVSQDDTYEQNAVWALPNSGQEEPSQEYPWIMSISAAVAMAATMETAMGEMWTGASILNDSIMDLYCDDFITLYYFQYSFASTSCIVAIPFKIFNNIEWYQH